MPVPPQFKDEYTDEEWDNLTGFIDLLVEIEIERLEAQGYRVVFE